MKKIIYSLIVLIASTLLIRAVEVEDCEILGDAIVAKEGSTKYLYFTGTNGFVHIKMFFPEDGNYIIWCRVKALHGNADSFFVSMDGVNEDVFITQPSPAEWHWGDFWQWVRINGRGGITSSTYWALNPRVFPITIGWHTLSFRAREINTYIDKVFFAVDQDTIPVDG